MNNAGITRDKLILRMTEEDWDQVIRVNLKGTFTCTKAVIRHLLKKGGSHSQYCFRYRSHREPGPGKLRGEQGGHHRLHKEHSERIRREGREGERGGPGLHCNRHDRCATPKYRERMTQTVAA